MRKLKKMDDFLSENHLTIGTLQMSSLHGGIAASGTTSSESYSSGTSQCPDTENWTYSDSGTPIKGTYNYPDGTYSPIFP